MTISAIRQDLNAVLPIIQHVWYPRSFVPKQAEFAALARDPDDVRPVVRPLAEDLLVSYGIRTNKGYRPVSVNLARSWGVNESQLHARALDNLRLAIDGKVKSFPFQTFRALHVGNELEASCLLLGEVWDRLQLEVDGQLRVAVAARSMVAFTGTESWGEHNGKRFPPVQCIAMMSGSARLVKGDVRDQTLSSYIFARSPTGWEASIALDDAERCLYPPQSN